MMRWGWVEDVDFPGGRGVGREEATLNPKICNMFFYSDNR